MKIIKVESCDSCPYIGRGQVFKCGLMAGMIVENYRVIPQWCPLEDTVDMIPVYALESLQQHLEKGDYIDYDKFCRKGISRKLALWNPSGELIVSGKNMKELLNNLLKLAASCK